MASRGRFPKAQVSEALNRNDRAKTVEIQIKNLKVFSTFNEDLHKEITHLLTHTNFRGNEQLSKYGDYLRRSFGSMLDVIPLADYVTKLTARCELCGKRAFFIFEEHRRGSDVTD